MKRRFFVYIICILFILAECEPTTRLDPPENNIEHKTPQDSLELVYEPDSSELIYELVYYESFGGGNINRLAQSMAIANGKVFIFLDNSIPGQDIGCNIYEIDSFQKVGVASLPIKSHNNNAQFTNIYYDINDKYPLLLLSRGDYPGGNSDFYLIRIIETIDSYEFHSLKTFHCTIPNASYNGSWIYDTDRGQLLLYTMTKGDWRKKDDNALCIFIFSQVDLLSCQDEFTLTEDDVIAYYEYSYGILQGGTYFNNKIYLPVQKMASIIKNTGVDHNLIVIDVTNGKLVNFAPSDVLENEGIAAYSGSIYLNSKWDTTLLGDEGVMFKILKYPIWY